MVVPLGIKDIADPQPKDARETVKIVDEEQYGFLGFVVTNKDHRIGEAWYSSLETLPRQFHEYVKVSGTLCSEVGCFNKKYRKYTVCQTHYRDGRQT